MANAPAQAWAFDFLGERSIMEKVKFATLKKTATFPQNAKMTGF